MAESDRYGLYWISEDGQDSLPMGRYGTLEVALDAIDAAQAEVLEQCADPTQRHRIYRGSWRVEDEESHRVVSTHPALTEEESGPRWYRLTAYNGQPQYACTDDWRIVEAALAWLNRGRGYDPYTAADVPVAEWAELERRETTPLVTMDSTEADFEDEDEDEEE